MSNVVAVYLIGLCLNVSMGAFLNAPAWKVVLVSGLWPLWAPYGLYNVARALPEVIRNVRREL